MINVFEQGLVGPQGGQPLSFKNDLFGPLGDRVTIISDFKKPIKDDSQRVLLAIALEDSKAFQNTLTRVFELAQAAPQKREFQGTTIYDFPINLPNPNGGPNVQGFKGPISLAVAKEACSSPPTRPCSSRCSDRGTPAWPTAQPTRPSPRSTRRKRARSPTFGRTNPPDSRTI